jgi:L-asparaginase II
VPTAAEREPVLVEVIRSGLVESVHRVSAVLLDPAGRVEIAAGDVRSPCYPRSANKPFQATALEACAPGTLSARELAIASASHSGEPEHLDLVDSLLRSVSLSSANLACPAAYPLDASAARRVAQLGGDPEPLMMNCSGKHAAMLATSVRSGWPVAGYTNPEHPLQQAVRATIERLAGQPISHVGVDGCGAPLFALPLLALARAFGAVVRAEPDTPEFRVAAVMRAHPFLVAGSGRLDTVAMRAVPGLLAKGGAEGVHAAALPDGTAFAVKAQDGARRAAQVVFLRMLRRLGVPDEQLLAVRGAVSPAVHGGPDVVGHAQVRPETLP